MREVVPPPSAGLVSTTLPSASTPETCSWGPAAWEARHWVVPSGLTSSCPMKAYPLPLPPVAPWVKETGQPPRSRSWAPVSVTDTRRPSPGTRARTRSGTAQNLESWSASRTAEVFMRRVRCASSSAVEVTVM